jgi:phage virion morphogenesis protein
MSGSQLIFDGSYDDEAIRQRLRDLDRASNNLTPAMKNIGEHMVQSTEANFNSESGPDGQKWQDVTPARRAKKKHSKILTESLHLRQSFIPKANRKSVTVGTVVPYAAVHQFGFDGQVKVPQHQRTIKQAFGRNLKAPVTFTVAAFSFQQHMPARPSLGVSQSDREEIVSIIEDHIAMALK